MCLNRNAKRNWCLEQEQHGTATSIRATNWTEERIWSIEEIKEQMGKGVFTPNFEQEVKRVSLWKDYIMKKSI